MQTTEAIEVIEAMTDSFKSLPNQFHFKVNVQQIGTLVQSSSGGVGMNISVTGGGAGSKTTGLSSTASTGSISAEIVKEAAIAEIDNQAAATIAMFEALVTELKTAKPQSSSIKSILAKLATGLAPPLMIAAIRTLLAKCGIEA